jgi:sigma-E factor negative regulatory protein RseC
MEEIGRVLDVGEDSTLVRVEIEGKGTCHSCVSRHMCVPLGGDRRMMTEAINERGARRGDMVRIEMSPKSTVGAAFLLYVLPVIALFLGYALGYLALGDEKYGIASGLVLLALGFVLLKVLNPFFSKGKRFKPIVVEIIQRGNSTESDT